MGTVNISLPNKMIEKVDDITKRMHYASRSELVRNALREFLVDTEWMTDSTGPVVVTVATTYDSGSRVSEEVNRLLRRYEALILSMTHCHISNMCVEIMLAKGDMSDIRSFAQQLRELKGVRKVRVTVA